MSCSPSRRGRSTKRLQRTYGCGRLPSVVISDHQWVISVHQQIISARWLRSTAQARGLHPHPQSCGGRRTRRVGRDFVRNGVRDASETIMRARGSGAATWGAAGVRRGFKSWARGAQQPRARVLLNHRVSIHPQHVSCRRRGGKTTGRNETERRRGPGGVVKDVGLQKPWGWESLGLHRVNHATSAAEPCTAKHACRCHYQLTHCGCNGAGSNRMLSLLPICTRSHSAASAKALKAECDWLCPNMGEALDSLAADPLKRMCAPNILVGQGCRGGHAEPDLDREAGCRKQGWARGARLGQGSRVQEAGCSENGSQSECGFGSEKSHRVEMGRKPSSRTTSSDPSSVRTSVEGITVRLLRVACATQLRRK